MVKRIAIFSVSLLLAAVLIAVGALLWVTSDAGSRIISDRLKAELLDKAGIEISFKKIGVDLFPPRISVQKISGKDKDGRFFCTMEEAELSPNIPALLAQELVVEEVYLGAPRCTVSLKKTDIDELAKRLKSDADEPSFDFDSIPRFDVFAVSNADLRVDIADPERIGMLRASLSGFGLDVTGDASAVEIRGLLKQLSGTWRKKEKKVAEKLTGLEFRAALSQSALDIRYLTTRVADVELQIREARIPLPLWPEGPSADDITVRLSLDTLGRLPLGLPNLTGTASFSGSLGVSEDAAGKIGFTSVSRIELLDIEADDFVVGDVVSKIAVSPSEIGFSETEIRTADGNIRLDGNISLKEHLPIELRADLNNIELGRLLEQLTVDGSYVTQNMSGPVKLSGTLDPPLLSGNVKIDVRDHITRTGSFRSKNYMTAISLPKTSVIGPIVITDKSFEAKNLSVKSGLSRVNVSMAFDFPGFSWRLQADSNDLYLNDLKHILGFEVSGHGPVHCTIAGPINDPRIRARGDFVDAVLEGMKLDRVGTDINFYNLLLSFDGLEVARKKSRLFASDLTFDFSAPGGLAINTKIDTDRADVETLMEVFGIDEKRWGSPVGRLFGRLALHYNLEPERLEVSADLVHDKIQVFGERFGPDVLRVEWNNGLLTVNELGLTKGRGTIYVTGAMRPDGTMSFLGNVEGVNLSAVNHPSVRQLDIDARMRAFAVIEGTLDRPRGSIDIRLGKAERHGARFGPSEVSLSLDGDTLTGKGTFGGELVRLEHLMVDLKRERFQVEGFVDDLDVVPILAKDKIPGEPSAVLTGDLSFSGRLDDASDINGRAELMSVKVKLEDFEFENKTPLAVLADNSQFSIQNTRFLGPGAAFDFGGALTLDEMNLKIKGTADLKSVSGMVEGIAETRGRLGFELVAAGAFDAPSFQGNATVQDGLVRIGGFPHAIKDIEGAVSITPKIIRFVNFSARGADGKIGMNGEVELTKGAISDYGFRLTAENLAIEAFKDLSFKVSTRGDGLYLAAPKPGELPTITGDAEISSLRYTDDIRVLELSDLSVDRLSGTQVTAKNPKVIDSAKDFFSFDIRLHGERNIEAHNNLFDATLAFDDREKPFRFVGTNQNLGFLGRILGTEGKVRFAGRRFDIRYAVVDFQDANRPDNPYFQVIAEGTVRDWKVTLTAEGTVDEYELKFSSQPYLSQEDIAFLILTGLTQAENRQFNRGVNLGMPLLGQLGPGGSSALPVELQVYSQYSDNAGKETTRIAMGRWINEDIWVSISSAVGQTRDMEAQVDYKINDAFSISGSYEEGEQNTGNVGLDLKFRLEF